jgi:hypothetical protein
MAFLAQNIAGVLLLQVEPPRGAASHAETFE